MSEINSMQNLTLNENDIRHLLEDNSSDSRVGISTKIASSYSGAKLDAKEQQIAEHIFRLLMRDTEVKVRASLAENLKESLQIPRDIVMSMVKDVAEVSLPLLEYSQILSDDDLMDIISSTQDNSRFSAIARRKTVSETLTDSLVHKGNEEVVATLLKNDGAAISENVFVRIIEKHKNDESLMEMASNRQQLSIHIAEKLISAVSTSIAESLRNTYKIPKEYILKEVEKTRESETLELVRSASSHDAVDNLIVQLQGADRLTPSMILGALCQGNFDFFESSLAKLSNITVENACTLIADRGELGFRAIYNKSGLPEAMFPAVKLLLKIIRELDNEGEKTGTANYSNHVVERILRYSEETPVENLSYIIALVRRSA